MAHGDLNDPNRTDLGTTGAAADTRGLRRLSELKDYEVADGYPDIRGWQVRTPDGQVLGKVDDLVVSVSEMRVRYLDVDVDRSVRSGLADAATPKGAEKGHALVPIGTAQLGDDAVLVNSLSGADLASYPTYARDAGINREYEESLRNRLGGTAAAGTVGAAGAAGASTSDDFYAGEHFDDSRFYGSRRSASDAEVRTNVSREGTAAGGSAGTSAGASGSSSDSYFVRRGGAAGLSDVSGSSGSMGSGAADRATNSGFADRLADKADNLKDRVDGNPASKPGPDATDRRI